MRAIERARLGAFEQDARKVGRKVDRVFPTVEGTGRDQ